MLSGEVLRRLYMYEGITERHFADRHKLLARTYKTRTDKNGYAFIPLKDKNALVRIYSHYYSNRGTLELQGVIHDINGSISLHKQGVSSIRAFAVTNVTEINNILAKQQFRDSLFFIFKKDGQQFYYHKANGFAKYNPATIFTDYPNIAGYADINSISTDEWGLFYNQDIEIRLCSKFNYFKLPTIRYCISYTHDGDVMFDITGICKTAITDNGLQISSRRINGDIEVIAINSIYDIYPNYLKGQVL